MVPDAVVLMLAINDKDFGRYIAKMVNVKADFFDDQKNHLLDLNNVPAVHIPFGVANKTMSMQSKKKEPKKKTTK